MPSHFKALRHVRPKPACVKCQGIFQADAPGRPIARGLPGPGLMALDSAYIAAAALRASALMCMIYPLLDAQWLWLRFGVLLVWGVFVVADSAQLSEVSARSCPPQWVGSALALQNSIGFAISIISITALLHVVQTLGDEAVWLLLPGPVLGLSGMRGLSRPREVEV